MDWLIPYMLESPLIIQHHPVDGNKVSIDANIGVIGIIVCSVNYNTMGNSSLSNGPSG